MWNWLLQGVPEQKLRAHLGSLGVTGNLALQPMYTLSGNFIFTHIRCSSRDFIFLELGFDFDLNIACVHDWFSLKINQYLIACWLEIISSGVFMNCFVLCIRWSEKQSCICKNNFQKTSHYSSWWTIKSSRKSSNPFSSCCFLVDNTPECLWVPVMNGGSHFELVICPSIHLI